MFEFIGYDIVQPMLICMLFCGKLLFFFLWWHFGSLWCNFYKLVTILFINPYVVKSIFLIVSVCSLKVMDCFNIALEQASKYEVVTTFDPIVICVCLLNLFLVQFSFS